MSESEIYADPERIKTLANEIRLFTNSLKADLMSLDEAIGHLGSTWKDAEFDKFRNSYRKLSQRLENIASEINKNEPQLKEDAEALAHYLRLQQP